MFAVSTVDCYGYNNSSYNAQTAYDDYSSGYTDINGYTQSMPGKLIFHKGRIFIRARINLERSEILVSSKILLPSKSVFNFLIVSCHI